MRASGDRHLLGRGEASEMGRFGPGEPTRTGIEMEQLDYDIKDYDMFNHVVAIP